MSADEVASSQHEPDDDAWTCYQRQLKSMVVRDARIVTPIGYEPKEVWASWSDSEEIDARSYIRRRGFITRRREYIPFDEEKEPTMKFYTQVYSPNSEYQAYVTESLSFGHIRDVIQICSVKFNTSLYSLVLPPDHFHGPIILKKKSVSFFKFSPCSKKLLYLARPAEWQLNAQNKDKIKFVVGLYDLISQKVSVITDECVCETMFNEAAIEWAPDSAGIIFHRENHLYWYRIGENDIAMISTISGSIPPPLGISVSPCKTRFALFLPITSENDTSVFVYRWPLKFKAGVCHEKLVLGKWQPWMIPDRPWAKEGEFLVLNVNWQYLVRTMFVYVDGPSEDDDDCTAVTFIESESPIITLDVHGDEMLFEKISANNMTSLCVCDIPPRGNKARVSELTDEEQEERERKEEEEDDSFDFKVKIFEFEETHSVVVYTPIVRFNEGVKLPMIVVPNSLKDGKNFTVVDRDPLLSTFSNCGYVVAVVNYRTPFEPVENTRFPKFDYSRIVEDIHVATRAVLSAESIDEDGVFIYGFEFGSFIAACTVAAYPDTFQKCALVRPILEFPEGVAGFPHEVEPSRNLEKFNIPMMLVGVSSEATVFQKLEEHLNEKKILVVKIVGDDYMDDVYNPSIIDFFEN